MRALVRRPLIAGATLASLLLVSLAGCALTGGTTTTDLAATTVAPPLNTPSPTTPPTMQVASGACGPHIPYDITFSAADGLAVSQTSGRGNLAYPQAQIPNSQPAEPMQEPATIAPASYVASAAPVVNPRLSERGGGYVLMICNPSNQAHTLSAVQISIAATRPFTDQLWAWAPCQGAYFPTGGHVSGGCGGADFENEYMHASFAADAQTGASVTAIQTGTNGSDASAEVNLGPLPVTLQPGRAMTIEIGMTPPTASGYYTFGFALTVDGASTGVVTYSQTTLIAPVAVSWSGAACQTSAMQAKIAQMPTPSAANAGYICPAS